MQLHEQAFPEVTRPNAGRIHALQLFQSIVKIVDVYRELGRQQFNELFKILCKIAVVIQAVDQQTNDSSPTLRNLAKA